jgi:hypothetical protein
MHATKITKSGEASITSINKDMFISFYHFIDLWFFANFESMLTISTKTKVKKNRTVTFKVPATIPVGEYDMVVVLQNEKTNQDKHLPITYASLKADVTALAGIWKGKDITLEDIRKKAWGNRL